MSRAIGFRAWVKPLKRYANGIDTILYHKECDVEGGGIWSVVCEEWDSEVYECDNIVVEQYTGLTDKNGKKIYENDIIKDTSDGDCLINAVFWCEKGGFWGVKPRSPFAEREWGWFIGRDNIEVIGNVHENPELLGGEK